MQITGFTAWLVEGWARRELAGRWLGVMERRGQREGADRLALGALEQEWLPEARWWLALAEPTPEAASPASDVAHR